MRKDQKDPIGWLFEQAIAEGHSLEVATYWPCLAQLWGHALCYHEDDPLQENKLQRLIRGSRAGLEQHPNACPMLPREYERLVLAIDGLQKAVDEFGEAMAPLMNRLEVTPYEEPST